MDANLTVIKLGGALLTDRSRRYTLRQVVLDQAAQEIRSCLDSGLIERLILVHGVGSYGHPPVFEHRLHKGLQSPEQLIHLTHTQNIVIQMRLAIAEAFHRAGIPVSTIMPSACMTASGFGLKTSYYDAVAGFLELGMVPLPGGDVLADDQVGFCAYSCDKVAVDLALHFNASCLIFATKVDGIYDRDPAKHPDAQHIKRLSLSNLGSVCARLDEKQKLDASGAMAGKLSALRPSDNAIACGLRVHVLSMMNKRQFTCFAKRQASSRHADRTLKDKTSTIQLRILKWHPDQYFDFPNTG